MATDQVAALGIGVLLGFGAAVWLVPWLVDRRAYRAGLEDAERAPLVDIAERLRPHLPNPYTPRVGPVNQTAGVPPRLVSPVDPENASY